MCLVLAGHLEITPLPQSERRNHLRHEGHLLSGKTGVMVVVVGVEDRSNEWVGQTTITTALSHAVDHDTSPANPSTLTSPSSLFNISCGAEHKRFPQHVRKMSARNTALINQNYWDINAGLYLHM